MSKAFDSVVSTLFVEPRIFAQLELLHAAQESRAPLSLSCVATCAGARDALEYDDFDYLLLSTNLEYQSHERRELAALVQIARGRGVVVMSFGVGDSNALGLPMLDSLASLYDSVRRAAREREQRASAHLSP